MSVNRNVIVLVGGLATTLVSSLHPLSRHYIAAECFLESLFALALVTYRGLRSGRRAVAYLCVRG
jgi:hypothetical protein